MSAKDGSDIFLPAIASMTGGESLVSAFVIARSTGHELLLFQQGSFTSLGEKISGGFAPQHCHCFAMSKNRDIAVFLRAKRKAEAFIVIGSHTDVNLPCRCRHSRAESGP